MNRSKTLGSCRRERSNFLPLEYLLSFLLARLIWLLLEVAALYVFGWLVFGITLTGGVFNRDDGSRADEGAGGQYGGSFSYANRDMKKVLSSQNP